MPDKPNTQSSIPKAAVVKSGGIGAVGLALLRAQGKA